MNKVEWISVNESYPEEGADVLAILPDMSMIVAYTDCNRWLTSIDRYDCLIDEPTHWAYLPEPPIRSKKGKWKPKKGEGYWYRTGDGEIDWDVYGASDYDKYTAKPIFSTRKECEKYCEFMDNLEKEGYAFSEEEWRDGTIIKYSISLDSATAKLYVSESLTQRTLGTPYFISEVGAQAIINYYKEELLKYYFGVEE